MNNIKEMSNEELLASVENTGVIINSCIKSNILKADETRREFYAIKYRILDLISPEENHFREVASRVFGGINKNATQADIDFVNQNWKELSGCSRYEDMVQQFSPYHGIS